MSETKFPSQPTSADQILDSITEMQKADADWRHGRLFSLIYHSESELEEVTKAAYMSCFSLNALSHGAFPSLARMEADTIGMTADLLGQAGDQGPRGDRPVVGSSQPVQGIRLPRSESGPDRPGFGAESGHGLGQGVDHAQHDPHRWLRPFLAPWGGRSNRRDGKARIQQGRDDAR